MCANPRALPDGNPAPRTALKLSSKETLRNKNYKQAMSQFTCFPFFSDGISALQRRSVWILPSSSAFLGRVEPGVRSFAAFAPCPAADCVGWDTWHTVCRKRTRGASGQLCVRASLARGN